MRRRSDLLARAAVVLVTAGAALLPTPAPVVGALVLLSLVLAAERLARQRGRGALDVVLISAGGVVGVVVAVGVVLGDVPVGLSPRSWALALSAVALAGLAAAWPAARPPAEAITATHVAEGLRALPWVAVTLVVAAVAISLSTQSVAQPGPAPLETSRAPLRMSFGAVSGTNVDVVVASPAQVGPLEVRTTIGSTQISYPLFSLTPGASHTTTLAVPATGRYVITLSEVNGDTPLRSLILDR